MGMAKHDSISLLRLTSFLLGKEKACGSSTEYKKVLLESLVKNMIIENVITSI